MTTYVTWDPGDAIVQNRGVFSNGNLTFAGRSGQSPVYSNTTPVLAMATEGKQASSGLWYFEVHIDNATFNNVGGVGLAPCTGLYQGLGFGVNNGVGGSNPSGFGYFPSNGTIFAEGTGYASLGSTYGQGDVISIAVDTTNKKCWCRKNNGNWCGTSGPNGVANPVTNVQGFDISASLNVGRIYPAVQLVDTTAQVTANFGATSFAESVPSGYGGWTLASPNVFGSLWTDEVQANGQLPAGGYTAQLGPWVCPVNCSLNTVIGPAMIARSGTNSTQILVYDSSGTGGAAGALVGKSQVNTTIALGENTYTFSPALGLTGGQTYWIGISTDGANPSTYYAINNQTLGSIVGTTDASITFASPPANWSTASPATFQKRVPFLMEYTPAAVTNFGAIAQTLGGITQAAAATISIPPGTISQTLGRITQQANGADLGIVGTVTQTLGRVTQQAEGADLSALAKLRQLWAF